MIGVRITRRELVEHDACDEGITLFERIAPSGILEIPEWTALHALWLAVAEPSHCGWLVGQGIIPRAYLRGADLTRAYLTRAYLRGAYLRGAYLTGAYLRGADLEGADLRGADLTGAYLTGAYLTGAYAGTQGQAPAGWRLTPSGFLEEVPR
mgnify:CR=1 FL=1